MENTWKYVGTYYSLPHSKQAKKEKFPDYPFKHFSASLNALLRDFIGRSTRCTNTISVIF